MERGIGETRYAQIESGEIVAGRVALDGIRRAGSVLKARLITSAPRNAIARDEQGVEYLLPRGSSKVPEGGQLSIEVTRETIPGGEPWKRPLARLTDVEPGDAPSVEARLVSSNELGDAGWDDLIDEARSGIVRFAGGELRLSPTPAMTLIDVDGYLPPDELAVIGAAEAAKAIRRLDIGGSIGIDLPTAGSKSARQRAAERIDAVLPQPFERTAVNGFGFAQIVRPRTCASLIELAQDKASFETRVLLRRVAFEPAGSKRLVAHPAVISALEAKPDWLDALARQVGGAISLRADAALPMSGGYAEQA
jgi:ribonuclease G